MTIESPTPLLAPGDPPPVHVINEASASPIVLLCEHAGRAVPRRLNGLDVGDDVLCSHRGWDIGAAELAHAVARELDAPLILQRYSRLVIDANRPPSSEGSMPRESDGVAILGNQGISPADKQARVAEIFDPMDSAIRDMLVSKPRKACFSIHSFTPQMGAEMRPWHAGFLCRRDVETATSLMDTFKSARPDLTFAINEPYQIDDASDWFIPAHAERSGLAHALVEIRNDQLGTPEQIMAWAALLSKAIKDRLQQI